MIKRWKEFINEQVEAKDYIAAKMQELEDEIQSIDDVESGSSLMYSWNRGEDEHLIINFAVGDIPYRYELDLKKDTPYVVREYIDNKLSFEEETEGEEDGIELIEQRIRDILGLYEAKRGRPKSQRYKGRKIPGKYLSGPHPGKMKKEIDRFRDSKDYKKDWDADYESGKGGKGKRVKTKKSAATLAYQKMFGKK